MAQNANDAVQWKRGILPCILGCIVVLVGEELDASGLEPTMSIGIIAIIFFLIALLVGRAFSMPSGFNMLSIGLGVAIGTSLYPFVDPTHNLWPIEIIVFLVIGAIPIASGAFLGSFWRTRSANRPAR